MFTSVTSVVPYFVISALLLLFAWVICSKVEFFRSLLDAEGAAARFHSIDGLRGFLALAVFFHHAVIARFYYVHGRWELPPSRFYGQLGQVGVALFFMITAFLFWSKGLNARPYLRAQPMIWGRICRLVPMYLFSIATAVVIAFALVGFEIREPIGTLVVQVMAWLSFGFFVAHELNGMTSASVINGAVQWSLAYEWAFYLFLPLGLIFARGLGFLLLAFAASLVIQGFSANPVEWNFLFGALAAVLVSNGSRIPQGVWKTPALGIVVLGAIGTVLASFETAYGPLQALLLFIAFMCVANGNDVFGLLSSRPARLVGAISYSVYLMHAIVLFVVLRLANAVSPIATMGQGLYWVLVAVCGLLVVAVSTATYRTIEHPLMKKPMPSWLGSRAGEPTAREGVGTRGTASS